MLYETTQAAADKAGVKRDTKWHIAPTMTPAEVLVTLPEDPDRPPLELKIPHMEADFANPGI